MSQGSHRYEDIVFFSYFVRAIIPSTRILLFMQIFAYLIVKVSVSLSHTIHYVGNVMHLQIDNASE